MGAMHYLGTYAEPRWLIACQGLSGMGISGVKYDLSDDIHLLLRYTQYNALQNDTCDKLM